MEVEAVNWDEEEILHVGQVIQLFRLGGGRMICQTCKEYMHNQKSWQASR
jgi:hypothetical protein